MEYIYGVGEAQPEVLCISEVYTYKTSSYTSPEVITRQFSEDGRI